MGLVRFNQQTLTIDGVPDGHVIVAEADYNAIRQARDQYALLKSKIPVGVPENELASLIEKGQRYDPLNQELSTVKTQFSEVDTRLKGFANMPKEFTIEKWNSFTKKEKDEIFGQKINTLTEKAYERVKKDFKLDAAPKVDPRFIPVDVLEKFDPDAKDAEDKWYQILDQAHTEQEKFVKDNLNTLPPPSPNLGGGQAPSPQTQPVSPIAHPRMNDVVGDGGLKVGQFTGR